MPYHAPTELEEALDLLGSGDVTVVAGGTDYFPARDRYGPRPALLDVTRIGGGNVAGLQLAWAFELPQVTDARSQPVIVGDTLFLKGPVCTGPLWAPRLGRRAMASARPSLPSNPPVPRSLV